MKKLIEKKGMFLGIAIGILALLSGLVFSGFNFQDTFAATVPNQQVQNPPVIRINVTESYVNTLVKDALKDNPMLSNPVVDLHNGDTASVAVNLQFAGALSLRPTAQLHFTVVNNRVQIEITEITVQGFAIPTSVIRPQLQTVTSDMESQINQVIVAMENETGLELTSLKTTETELIIGLSEKPAASVNPSNF
jgi:hypothetical protein